MAHGKIQSLLGLLTVTGLASSCFSPSSTPPVQYDRLPIPGTQTATARAIQSIRPGLAVRGMACLACHAQIQASLITDFGNGDPWFLDHDLKDGSGSPATPASLFGQSHYNPFTWQSMEQMTGRIVVPVAEVPADIVAHTITGTPSGPMALDAYLLSSSAQDQSPFWSFQYWGVAAPASSSFTARVTPDTDEFGNSVPKVDPLAYLYIGAPDATQVLAAAPAPGRAGPWIQTTLAEGFSGISFVDGLQGHSYATNTDTVQCTGQDVFINGTLLLDNAQLIAGNGGCRLYVSGPVFIEGPITYLDGDATHNLQITSATAIIMGVGLQGSVYSGGSHAGLANGSPYSTTPLHNRLIGDSRNPVIRSAPTASAYAAWANSVMAEAQNIGSVKLVDASATGGASMTAQAAEGHLRVAINYDHLLLNAPIIHSRYLGVFKGVIVAEIALFSLGEFHFEFDDVFSTPNVPILPELGSDILCASGTQAGCTPISGGGVGLGS